jgi:nickel-dependent lactate racemase
MLRVPYGDGHLGLRVPRERVRLVEPRLPEGTGEPLEAFRPALDEPAGCVRLEEMAAGRTVTYLVDDATRAEPHEAFIRSVLERLTGAAFVRCIVATGSHERLSPGNERILACLRAVAGEMGVRHEALVHDCEAPDLFVGFGETSRGTPIEVSRPALGADVIVITSDVKNHYFAGYSNPLKSILPGVSSFAAIERNHSLALHPLATFGRHPWHPDPPRRVNPVSEDMLEGVRAATAGKDLFALAAVTVGGRAVWAGAGQPEVVTPEAIAQVDRIAGVRVEPAGRLIVSPGGDPQDETLYNAQRGLELSRNGVREGGEVLFVARCGRGVAPTLKSRAEFYDRLTAPLDEVIAGLEERYVLYSHKAYKFAQFIRSVGRISMVTDLPAGQVAAAHMEKAPGAQEVVDRWLAEPDEPILVTTQANKVALYA